jgi:hypothetical protein
VVNKKFTNVSEVLAASVIRVMSLLILLNFYQTTWCYNPKRQPFSGSFLFKSHTSPKQRIKGVKTHLITAPQT